MKGTRRPSASTYGDIHTYVIFTLIQGTQIKLFPDPLGTVTQWY